MRFALSSLILAAGLAGVAHAQTPAPAAAPPAAPAAAPATPGPAPATTGAMAAPPATAAAPPAAAPAGGGSVPTLPGADQAPPPAPTLPTTGDGAEAIAVLEKVCVPSVKGGKFEDIAKSAGFKLNRRDQTWAKQLGATSRDYQIIIYPPGSNKNVCNAELHYAPGASDEILKALNVWAFVHQPPLDPTANYTQPQDPDGLKRVRRSWEYLTQNSSVGLNFSTVRKPDDSQVNAKYDMGTLQYQERTF